MNINHLLNGLKRVRAIQDNDFKDGSQNEFEADCPSHSDNSRSLSITIFSNSYTLLQCNSGCEADSIYAVINSKLKKVFSKRYGTDESRFEPFQFVEKHTGGPYPDVLVISESSKCKSL